MKTLMIFFYKPLWLDSTEAKETVSQDPEIMFVFTRFSIGFSYYLL